MKNLTALLTSLLLVSCGSNSSTSSQSQTQQTTANSSIIATGTMSGLPTGFYVIEADPIKSLSSNQITYGLSGYCATSDSVYTYNGIDTANIDARSFKIIGSVLSMHIDSLNSPNGDSLHLYRLSGSSGIQGIWNEKDSQGNIIGAEWFTTDSVYFLVTESYFKKMIVDTKVGTGSSAVFGTDGFLSSTFQGSTFREADSAIVIQGHFSGVKRVVTWGGKTCSASLYFGDQSAAACAASWAKDSTFNRCLRTLVPNHPEPEFCRVRPYSHCGQDCVNMADTVCN